MLNHTKVLRNINKQVVFKMYNFLIPKFFNFFEKYLKIHVTPVHFYSPIPILSQLDKDIYEYEFSCIGINWNNNLQEKYLHKIFPKYLAEFTPEKNCGLSLVDSFILYAMIRENKPKKMVEIGSGQSTFIALNALEKNRNEGFPCVFTAVEPYPIKDLYKIENEEFNLIVKNVQNVPLDFFSDTDLLFIDSSHVSKIGSDVNYEILEIVPSLKDGALIHWHDILIPQNYWQDWIENGNQFWNESYMLHSFLQFNSKYNIQWASRYMHLNYFKKIETVFPYFHPNHRITSFWIKKG